MSDLQSMAWALFQRWESDWRDRHPDDDRSALDLLHDPVCVADWYDYAGNAPDVPVVVE